MLAGWRSLFCLCLSFWVAVRRRQGGKKPLPLSSRIRYWERDEIEVELKGKGTMPQSMARQLIFLHAAELAQEGGYAYFTLGDITGRVIAEEAQRRASAASILGRTREIAGDTGGAEGSGESVPEPSFVAEPSEAPEGFQDAGVGGRGRRGPESGIPRPIYDPDRPRLVVVAGFFRDRPPADRHYFEARIPIERLRAEYGL